MLFQVKKKKLFEKSFWSLFFPASSTSGIPKKLKSQLSHEVGLAGFRVKKGRKATEEEEGEIVSDPSDSESRRGEKRSRRYSSISNPDVEEKTSPVESTEKGAVAAKKSEESSEEEDTNEDKSEDDRETATATKRVRKEAKEATDVKQEESASESGSESEESSSEEDDDDEEEEDDDDDGKEEVVQNESKSKMKQQKETEVKASGSKELVTKNEDEAEDEESSSEEESSEEDSEEGESESDSSEESEQEEVKKAVSQKSEQVVERTRVEEFESEDLHKELQQLRRHRSTDERHKQKVRTERHHQQERVERRRGESSLDVRSDKDWKASDKGKGHSKYQNVEERRHSESKSKSRSYERGSRSGDVLVDSKQKESRDRHKSYSKESSKTKPERPGTREKHFEMEVDREKKSSRKNSEKRKKSSPEETAKLESKSKDRKDRSGSRRKSTTTEKVAKDSRDGGEDPIKPKKDEGKSLILTARERRQFTNEVVDIESEGSSVEDDKEEAHHDSEMKQLSDGEQKEDEKEKKAKLPAYYPAVRGCRNVEEFQWLNRIEEGTYGVVYRAKDKRTGDIVALKKLKMEREKEGFPITSLREINTLLKAQHPNIVTVREIVVGSNMDKIYIVMDYVEHDLKVLMEHMTQGFRIGEIKTLMIQLLRAVAHLHDNWILHRDLKASNLLLSNKGILKVGDFGLAREYGSPLKNYTPIVVTLWYRAPELLLGTKEYSTHIDLWSVGCIFAELLTMKPLFPGKSEIDQINRIFKDLGTPSDKIWPGPPSYSELPAVKKMTFTDYPYNNLRNKFGAHLTDKGFDLLNRFLTYDPSRRITAEKALEHEYFSESPQPVDPSMFPTWPAKSEMAKRPKKKDVEHSPQAPQGGAMFAKLADEGDSGNGSQGFRMPTSKKGSAAVVGFTLKF